jgi:membrane-bound lytic murein transglycosylase A
VDAPGSKYWRAALVALLLIVGVTLNPAVVVPADAHVHPVANKTSAEKQAPKPPTPDLSGPLSIPNSQLEPVAWSDLEGWNKDDQAAAFSTFLASCRAIVKSNSPDNPPLDVALQSVCRRAIAAPPQTSEAARAFFEDNFRPIRIAKIGESTGLLTGYYEPIVVGSRFPTQEFTVPVYRRPPDLVSPGVPRNASFPNKGKAMRDLGKGRLAPYYDRADIEDGVLDGQHLEICWLRDPVDLLFIQIQGSARVRLEDGTMLRINYDAHNGYPYTAVGRLLVEQKIVARDEMSMDRIRDWMLGHPEDSKALRRANRSFIFFRVTGLSGDDEPVGGQGVRLTAGRSIAVDRPTHVYGMPFFIEANLAIAGEEPTTPFRRLMIAQDTGSAIVGPARADLYFGAGEDAGRVAGRIRNLGKFTMLVPRELDPVEAGTHMPLPPEKPPLAKVTQQTDKGKKKPKLQASPEASDELSPEPSLERNPETRPEPKFER